MNKILALAACSLLLAGCSSDSQRDRALLGGGLGAATGAAIGAATGGGAGAAVAGAAIGAVGGGVIGAATAPKNCIATDQYGRRYYVACP
ncbi:bacteriocin [Stappia sp. GBMRC 2046]|uniref:Bacteriocin n=1 Tax=Stappia sediminis TaxID=2692190 RepID=A0A7X3LRB0_9HYPH|nr:bacteriocin [Stappia sediminis]MXN63655.1 bacteriocin [Stappia sediminis]